MTQGLEQYHLTHLKISLIYLLNLRYKVSTFNIIEVKENVGEDFKRRKVKC